MPLLIHAALLVAVIGLLCAIVLAFPLIAYDWKQHRDQRVAEDAAPPPGPFNQERDLDWIDLLDRDVSA